MGDQEESDFLMSTLRAMTEHGVARIHGQDVAVMLTMLAIRQRIGNRSVRVSDVSISIDCGFPRVNRVHAARRVAIENGWLVYRPCNSVMGDYRVKTPVGDKCST